VLLAEKDKVSSSKNPDGVLNYCPLPHIKKQGQWPCFSCLGENAACISFPLKKAEL
jgi:hypothetical protein